MAHVAGARPGVCRLATAGVNLVAPDAGRFGLQNVGTEVLDIGQVLRAGVGHHAGLGAAQELVDRPVDRFAEDVPQTHVDFGVVLVNPAAAAHATTTATAGPAAAPAAGSSSSRSVNTRRRGCRARRARRSASTTTSATASGRTCSKTTAAGIERSIGAETLRVGNRGEGTHVDGALAEHPGLGIFQEARRVSSIADGHVAFDPAVGHDGDDLAGLRTVEAADIAEIGDIDLNLLDGEVGQIGLLDPDCLGCRLAGIG